LRRNIRSKLHVEIHELAAIFLTKPFEPFAVDDVGRLEMEFPEIRIVRSHPRFQSGALRASVNLVHAAIGASATASPVVN
jgi:hypothetical protein